MDYWGNFAPISVSQISGDTTFKGESGKGKGMAVIRKKGMDKRKKLRVKKVSGKGVEIRESHRRILLVGIVKRWGKIHIMILEPVKCIYNERR